jgi:group I intron endonuclease
MSISSSATGLLEVHPDDARKTGIYCITINEKFYIGSCVDFGHRMKEHTRKLRAGRHVNKFMQGVFDKHQMFEAELIEVCGPDDLERLEQEYIDQWFEDERCMNLRPHAKTMLGFKHSQETRERIRAIRTGTKATAETKAKLSVVHTGRLHTNESKKKMSDRLKGKKKTEQHRQAMSRMKRRFSDEAVEEMRSRFAAGETQTAIAESFGCTQSAVHSVVFGKRLYLGGNNVD